jgi:hypothetical protein
LKGAHRFPAVAGEWIAVRRQIPAWIIEGEPYRPDVVLLMDPVSGLVLDVNAFKREDSADAVAAWIAQRVDRLPRGAERACLRIDDDELGSLLPQRLGPQWDVVVAPTPEATAALASLAASLTASPGAGGHFADGATREVVGRFFSAAARLFRAAPWREASDAQILALDAPAFGYANACLCIIGALGESLGVLVYRSMEDYLSLVRTAIRGRPITGPGVVTFAVNFDRSSSVARRLLQEAKREGWPVERGGFPTVAHIEPDAVLRPVGDRDYAFAAAMLEALSTFVAEHGSVFTRDELAMPVQVRYEDGAGAVVAITAPHPHATWEWGDSADAAALAAEKSRSRRGRRSSAPRE